MELEINETFQKHYNEYRAKEEASKTKKKLKKEIKEMEAEDDEYSSACSDAENEPECINKFIEHCNSFLHDIDTKSITEFLTSQPSFSEIVGDKRKTETEKPIFAKDLNRKILIENAGIDNEEDLSDIEKYSKIDSEEIFKLIQNPIDLTEIDNIDYDDDDDGEEFLRPSKNPARIDYSRIVESESNDLNRDDSNEESDGEMEDKKSIEKNRFGKIEINRDRKLVTVKVSKTRTRTEKRQTLKEKKEKELKEKMKKLQEIEHTFLLEKLEKIKKTLPKEIANQLSIDDLDDDFNIDEFSQKMSSVFEKEDGNIPVDEEKPVFSDESDIDFNDIREVKEEEMEEENEMEHVNKLSSKKKTKSILSHKKQRYFTNVEENDTLSSKKRPGIVRKNNENFNREKHQTYGNYLKKTFDFLCEDLIRGANDNDDLLCKFKFRKVEKQDYGLNIDEIIMADTKELNQWASLKKIVRLRTPRQEEKDRIKYSSEDTLKRKREILASVYREESEDEIKQEEISIEDQSGIETSSLSKCAKKHLRKVLKKKKQKEITEPEPMNLNDHHSKTLPTEIDKEEKNVSKKRKIVENVENQLIENPATENDHSEPKKKKSKKSKQIDNINQKIVENVENQLIENPATENDHSEPKKKKSKKSKQIDNENQNIDEGKNQKNKKPKKKKINANSVPILNANRLESMGINSGYYKHKLCKKDN